MRLILAGLLFVLAGCGTVRAHGTWTAGTDVGTIVTAGAMAIGLAIESDRELPLCDDIDPPHTCPGTTPGPLSPPPPPPPGE